MYHVARNKTTIL